VSFLVCDPDCNSIPFHFKKRNTFMSRIITFLGKAGTGHTTLAIATAKWFTQRGDRVLLVTHAPNPSAEILLGIPLTAQPQVVAPKLEVVQLQTTALLDQAWAEIKALITLYLPLPTMSEQVHPGELIILPGFDSALAFNALRQYYTSGDYDIIVYDGRGDLETLRLLGVPDVLDWYLHRFRQVFAALDVVKVAESIGGPLAGALVSVNMDTKKLEQEMNRIRDWITQGVAVVNDPQRLSAYLVTTDEPGAIAEACWLWGSAQQVNLRVGGVLVCQSEQQNLSALQQTFAPLSIHTIPQLHNNRWEPLMASLPDFQSPAIIPEPLTIDINNLQIHVFLPGFTKKQVKLTQFGNELTVEAGDQRRNIFLPPKLQNLPLQSVKFEAPYLIICF
jgi:anion-transporting  ArsA/GET3 family ATPase